MSDFQIIESTRQAGSFEIRQISDPGRFTGGKFEPIYRTLAEAETAAAKYQAFEDKLTSSQAATDVKGGEYYTKESALYGTGRVYKNLPGATHYNGGKTQIWDNA